MHAVDLLPVENPDQDGGKSGDAIVVEFPLDAEGRQAVMVIDGGRAYTSDQLIDHIREHCRTEIIDLMISTHPDADHLNGLTKVVEELRVRELLIHLPLNHADDIADFSNLEALLGLVKTALARDTLVTEPFAGLVRLGGQLRILGPTKSYYQELLAEQLGGGNLVASAEVMFKRATSKLKNILSYVPIETLDNLGQTSARNNSSVIAMLQADGKRALFTGDAGIPALNAAADYYETLFGSFSIAPLSMFQVPHHGSRRNLGPAILDRILGVQDAPNSPSCAAVISSAKVDLKHPSSKVVNALLRRGCSVIATEGKTISYGDGWMSRTGWGPIESLQYTEEDDDD